LKTKDALSRDFKGGSLRSRLFSTTPLASFLGSLPLLLSQEGTFAEADRSPCLAAALLKPNNSI